MLIITEKISGEEKNKKKTNWGFLFSQKSQRRQIEGFYIGRKKGVLYIPYFCLLNILNLGYLYKGDKLRVFFDFQKNENKHYYISSACSRIDKKNTTVEKGGEHRQIEYWHHLRHSWYGLAIVYQRTYIYFWHFQRACVSVFNHAKNNA